MNGAKGFEIWPRQNRVRFSGPTMKVPESCCSHPDDLSSRQNCLQTPRSPRDAWQDVSHDDLRCL